jgi:hypothetical protein
MALRRFAWFISEFFGSSNWEANRTGDAETLRQEEERSHSFRQVSSPPPISASPRLLFVVFFYWLSHEIEPTRKAVVPEIFL